MYVVNVDGSLSITAPLLAAMVILYQVHRYNYKTKTVSFLVSNQYQKGDEKLMEVEKLQRSTVERLRNVKKEHKISTSQIMDMLDKKGYFISEATIKRVFSEKSDPLSFRYRDTIAPLADALLEVYNDTSNSEDILALKSMIHDKNKLIDLLLAKNEELKADADKRIEHLQKQVSRLEKNLDFREKVVERKDAVIEKLINKVIGETTIE